MNEDDAEYGFSLRFWVYTFMAATATGLFCGLLTFGVLMLIGYSMGWVK